MERERLKKKNKNLQDRKTNETEKEKKKKNIFHIYRKMVFVLDEMGDVFSLENLTSLPERKKINLQLEPIANPQLQTNVGNEQLQYSNQT